MRRYPLSFIILTSLGVLCLIPGAISLAGFGASLHPVSYTHLDVYKRQAGDRRQFQRGKDEGESGSNAEQHA